MNETRSTKYKTYNILPGTKMGVLTAEHLEKLSEIPRKYSMLSITKPHLIYLVGKGFDVEHVGSAVLLLFYAKNKKYFG